MAAARTGDDETEESEGHEGGDEDEHDGEVNPEGPGHVEAGPDETGEGYDEDDEADDEERGLQEALARGAALRSEHFCPLIRGKNYTRNINLMFFD